MFWTWLITTKTGRTILASLATTLVVLLCWWGFASHYTAVGKQQCETAHAKAVDKANTDQAAKNKASNATSSTVAAKAATSAQKAVDKIDANSKNDKEAIRDAYKKPPVNRPVSYGSCVHPVSVGVQDRIGEAVDRANGQ